MTDLRLAIRPELPADDDIIERLHARAFGPGRFARTASRIREEAPHDPALCFTALVGTLVVGSVRQTPIRIGETRGQMLGPLTVDPAFEGRGIGAGLMDAAITAARGAGSAFILLVGDAPYYARFGFSPVPRGQITLPGPVDPARLLGIDLAAGALATSRGLVTARPAASS